MLPTIMSISEFLAQHKQSFFIYKGISYEIDELYQDDDGKYFVHGVSDDGEEATEEILMLRKEQIGAQLKNSI